MGCSHSPASSELRKLRTARQCKAPASHSLLFLKKENSWGRPSASRKWPLAQMCVHTQTHASERLTIPRHRGHESGNTRVMEPRPRCEKGRNESVPLCEAQGRLGARKGQAQGGFLFRDSVTWRLQGSKEGLTAGTGRHSRWVLGERREVSFWGRVSRLCLHRGGGFLCHRHPLLASQVLSPVGAVALTSGVLYAVLSLHPLLTPSSSAPGGPQRGRAAPPPAPAGALADTPGARSLRLPWIPAPALRTRTPTWQTGLPSQHVG